MSGAPGVAATILSQLGGGRFVAMTGARDLLDVGDGLAFRIGRNARKVNRVVVRLGADDAYSMEFGRVRDLGYRELERIAGVGAEGLRAAFTRGTGMDCTL